MRGSWRVAGAPVRAENVRAPTLVVAARRDRIAPPRATEAIARVLPEARVLRVDSGHVGMIVSRGAEGTLWRPLADFLLT